MRYDDCAPARPKFCRCGHLEVDHDLDDGCGGCAMHMVGPCREFRPRLGVAPSQGGDAVSAERRRVVGELRDFADDLYGITGARWIADALTSTLDRLSEEDK